MADQSRNLHRRFSQAYARAERLYSDAAQFGDVDKMDKALAHG